MYFSLVCAAILIISGWATFQESNLYLAGAKAPPSQLRAIADGSRLPGLSIDSHTAYLGDCLASLESLAAAYLSPAERAALQTGCMAAAQAIARAAPVFSYAWFAIAQLALADGRMDDFNNGLVLSEATGPNEAWLVGKRVLLASDNYDLLSDAASAAHDRDLTTLAGARFGIRSVAARYVVDSDFRKRIVPILEALPAEAQRRFVFLAKQILDARAPAP